jgi:hypothetical protein
VLYFDVGLLFLGYIMKKRWKNLVLTLYIVLAGLFFYSCSELFLPKRAEIKGMVDFPVKMGIANIGSALSTIIEKAFSDDSGEAHTEVYEVDYNGQKIQMSCIYLPIEVTEDFNPDHFLKTISLQLNDGLSDEPKKLHLETLATGASSTEIDLLDDANKIGLSEISLAGIARYVISIDFAECAGRFGDTIDSGIGLNFRFDTVAPGLVMTVKCAELSIEDTKLLKAGNNVFGNKKELTEDDALFIAGADGTKSLNFEVTIRSNGPNPDKLSINSAGLNPGDTVVVYDGEVAFFHNWTKSTIDLEAAIKAEDGMTGTLPRSAGEPKYFDLSSLGEYFDGFTFEGIEARLYMISTPIEGLDPILRLGVHYGEEKTGGLYHDLFSSDFEPLLLDDRFVNNSVYFREHLPGMADNIPELDLDKEVLTDVFSTMPDNLLFTYTLESDQYVDIYPHTMVEDPNTPDSSKIIAAIMILLPMDLRAVRDDSTISLPNVFGGLKDLFGRDEAGELFPSTDVRTIKMSISFHEPMFLGGYIFIDGNKNQEPLLFSPNGVKLNKKKIAVHFTKNQLEIVKGQLIKPNVWFKFKENDEIYVPKVLGVMSIKFEMRGIVELGELFE